MSNKYSIPKNSKIITGASRYAITEDGKVFSIDSWKFLKNNLSNKDPKKAYYQVWLRFDNGTQRWEKVHRLMAKMYVPNPLSLPEVNHKDRNKLHNFYTNLEWSTHRNNIIHARSTGVPWDVRTGERHPMFGRHWSQAVKTKMSESKKGEKHPKFKGYYIYEGKRFASCQDLADHIGTYPMAVNRMVKKGIIKIQPPLPG